MTTRKTVLSFGFACMLYAVLWLLWIRGAGASPGVPSQVANTITPTLDIQRTRILLPLTPHPTLSRFWLEDTQVKLNTSEVRGRSNIAWSREGDFLAYTYGYALYTVPVDQLDKPTLVYRVSEDTTPWSFDGGYLAWSPDDAAIGIGLTRNRGQPDKKAEWYMAQVDRQRQALSFIAPEQASMTDWSALNQIVAYRDRAWWIYDIPSLTWQPLTVPEAISNKYQLQDPQWATADTLLLTGSTDAFGNELMAHFAVFMVDVKTNNWETLPIQPVTNAWHPPFPVASPDGHWIAWIEDRMDFDVRAWRIMLYDRERSQVVEAANSRDYGFVIWRNLTWSPDSKQLAFSARRVRKPGDYEASTIWILHLTPPK